MMESYKMSSFSSWKSEDVEVQNKIIVYIITGICIITVVLLFIFLFA